MSEPHDPIPGQQAIPVPDTVPVLDQCAWCDGRAITRLVLEPAQYTWRTNLTGKKVKLVKRAALEAPVCQRHYKTLERSKAA